MRVSNTRSRRSSGFAGTEKVKVERATNTKANFAENLHSVAMDEIRRDLEELIPELDNAAHALLESRTLRNLNRYRQLVQDFLDKVVRQTHSLKEISGFSAGRHKIMLVVEKVNESLEKLGLEVLNQHASSVHLLEIADEIRGLLLDLYT